MGRRARDPDPFEDVDPKAVEPALLVVEPREARLGETIRRRFRDWTDRGALPAFYRDYEAITEREMRMTAYRNRVGQQSLDAGQTERLQAYTHSLRRWRTTRPWTRPPTAAPWPGLPGRPTRRWTRPRRRHQRAQSGA